MIGLEGQEFDAGVRSAMRAVLASMLLIFSAPALAGPEASGRIGLSLEIPPRVSLETR
jgi:hypothetical protein